MLSSVNTTLNYVILLAESSLSFCYYWLDRGLRISRFDFKPY
jgi:hypothetical protein